MTAKKVLLEAARLVQRGWAQRTRRQNAEGFPCDYGHGVRWCPIGAIYDVVVAHYGKQDITGYDARTAAIRILAEHLKKAWPFWFALQVDPIVLQVDPTSIVVNWNDAPDRTQEQVVAAMLAAAKSEEEHA